jgi:hypothetical protein
VVTNTSSQLSSLAQALETFIKAQTSSKDPQGKNGGGTSSAPTSPALNGNIIRSSNGVKTRILEETQTAPTPKIPNIPPITLPFSVPEILPLKPVTENTNYEEHIVTADLEAIITPEGFNHVYMAAWYNGTQSSILNLTQYSSQENFLKAFWDSLIKYNKGRICYFHNWGGYDSILSLPSLINLKVNCTFKPIIKDGELMSIEIYEGTTRLLTIKDSIRIIPGALGKLAKDWEVSTQKDHFPHYFWNGSIQATLKYTGTIPPYSSFEPKRTSKRDYDLMQQDFSSISWSFLRVSEQYILADCKALFQILFFFL